VFPSEQESAAKKDKEAKRAVLSLRKAPFL